MNRYKPEFLGKMIHPDSPEQVTDFVNNKYDAFSSIYDVCKDDLENINDVDTVDYVEGSSSLSVRISANTSTLENIKNNNDNENVKCNGNIFKCD